VDPADLTATFTVDFSGHKDLYDAFIKSSKVKKDSRWKFDNKTHIAKFVF
jgi:hypothetical protein